MFHWRPHRKKQICGRPGSNFFWLRHVWRWRRTACILSCLCNLSPWWVPCTYGNPYSSRTPNNDNRSLTRGFSGIAFMQTHNFLGWRNPGPPSRKVARKASWFLAARHYYWISRWELHHILLLLYAIDLQEHGCCCVWWSDLIVGYLICLTVGALKHERWSYNPRLGVQRAMADDEYDDEDGATWGNKKLCRLSTSTRPKVASKSPKAYTCWHNLRDELCFPHTGFSVILMKL